MEEISVYEASEQFLDWAHETSVYDKAKKVLLSEEEYERLVAYDSILQLRTKFLEELYKQ